MDDQNDDEDESARVHLLVRPWEVCHHAPVTLAKKKAYNRRLLRLMCLQIGHPQPFQVSIQANEYADHFEAVIRHVGGYVTTTFPPVPELQLYRVQFDGQWLRSQDIDGISTSSLHRINDDMSMTGSLFVDHPPEGFVRILVVPGPREDLDEHVEVHHQFIDARTEAHVVSLWRKVCIMLRRAKTDNSYYDEFYNEPKL